EDLAAFTHALRGRRVAESLSATWIPSGRARREALREAGLESVLLAAGVRILEPGMPPADPAAGAHLCFGVPWPSLVAPRRPCGIAGPEAAAASALAGAVAPPEVPSVARQPLPSAPVALPRAEETDGLPGEGPPPDQVETDGGDPLELTVAARLGDFVA